MATDAPREMSALALYQTVNTAWTECRLENVLQRQKELSALHANIKKSASALVAALIQGELNIENYSPDQLTGMASARCQFCAQG